MRGVRSQIKIQRLISGLEFQRPLSVGGWNGTVGFTWQRTSLLDGEGRNQTVRTIQNPASECEKESRSHGRRLPKRT